MFPALSGLRTMLENYRVSEVGLEDPRILRPSEVGGKMFIRGGTTATEQRLQQDIEQCEG